MYRQYSFLLVLPLIFTFSVLFFMYYNRGGGTAGNQNTVNAIIGDKSFAHTFGEQPGEAVPEHVRIKTHLQYVEGILRNRPVDHLSEEQQRNRFTHLNHLREYYQVGKFPHNDGHPDARRPTFISEDGNICAVGYLIEKSLGREVVEQINQKYKYNYIQNIDTPVFKNWVESSGFTLRELAMVQPEYGYGPQIVEEVKRNKNSVDLSYGIGSSVLAGANILYHTNNSSNPWLFNNASSNHWFGLAAGGGSILLGALNLENSQSYTEPAEVEGFVTLTPLRKTTITNHTRTALSIANMGVGLITTVRAGYHLIIKGTETREEPSSTSFRVTQLEPHPIQTSEHVPAVQMRVRF